MCYYQDGNQTLQIHNGEDPFRKRASCPITVDSQGVIMWDEIIPANNVWPDSTLCFPPKVRQQAHNNFITSAENKIDV
jgi:hypothetical protein